MTICCVLVTQFCLNTLQIYASLGNRNFQGLQVNVPQNFDAFPAEAPLSYNIRKQLGFFGRPFKTVYYVNYH